ncbi:MAG: YncE family protein [Methylomicrobium sp.]
MAITPDGTRAYVTTGVGIARCAPSTVSVIDTLPSSPSYNTVVSTIPVGNPSGVAITPDGKHAYIVGPGCPSVSVIETASNTIVGDPIYVGNRPMAVAITPAPVALDSFNRPNGRLGANWSGSAGLDYYKIVNNRVNVRAGGPIYWTPNSFGVNQEAFVTLNTVNPSGFEHGLMLKVQSGSNAINYRRGVINVDYHAQNNAVLVSTLRPNQSWKEYPELSSITFNNGDKLGARVYGAGPNAGTVHIYKNGAEIGVVTLDYADQTFFNPRGGNIGLWFGDAYGAIFDDFGGGEL